MAEEKKQAAVQVRTQKAQTTEAEKVTVPVELSSVNRSINIIKDGDRVTISLHPSIVEEIGAYRRCQVTVTFIEDGGVQVMPQLND